MTSGTVLGVYPMPHHLDKSEFTADTDSGTVWVTSILLHENYEAKVAFAVVNNELISHLILTKDLKSHSTMEAFLSCEAYSKKDKLFPSELCKDIQLQREGSETNREEEIIVKALDPWVSYINTPKRKVFTFRVDLKLRKEWEDSNHNSPSPVMQDENGEVAEWRAYVKVVADTPDDSNLHIELDQLWKEWQMIDLLPVEIVGPNGSQRRKNYMEYIWERKFKEKKVFLGEPAIIKMGNLWRQLIYLRYKSGDALDSEAAQRKLENSKLLIEHLKKTACNSPNSEAIEKAYKGIWGTWKNFNAIYDLHIDDELEKHKLQKQMVREINKTYSNDFENKEVERFEDFWRLLMDRKYFPEDTFGEGFTLENRRKRNEIFSRQEQEAGIAFSIGLRQNINTISPK